MNCSTNLTTEFDQTDDGIFFEVSDETLEAAAGVGDQAIVTVAPTIIVGGCCSLGLMMSGRWKAR